jgi:hypothetical protein
MTTMLHPVAPTHPDEHNRYGELPLTDGATYIDLPTNHLSYAMAHGLVQGGAPLETFGSDPAHDDLTVGLLCWRGTRSFSSCPSRHHKVLLLALS